MPSRTMTMTEQGKEEVWLLGHRGGTLPNHHGVSRGCPGEEQVGRLGGRVLPRGGPATAQVWWWETAVYVGRAGGKQPGTRRPLSPHWARRKVCTLDAKLPPAS